MPAGHASCWWFFLITRMSSGRRCGRIRRHVPLVCFATVSEICKFCLLVFLFYCFLFRLYSYPIYFLNCYIVCYQLLLFFCFLWRRWCVILGGFLWCVFLSRWSFSVMKAWICGEFWYPLQEVLFLSFFRILSAVYHRQPCFVYVWFKFKSLVKCDFE